MEELLLGWGLGSWAAWYKGSLLPTAVGVDTLRRKREEERGVGSGESLVRGGTAQ
jgi:hypothetical protein